MKILSKNVDLLAEADVVICGGGPAGIGAALAAARSGADVLLLEQTGTLGGMGTSGLVPAIISMTDGVNFLAGEICKEIVDKMCSEMNVKPNYGWQNINPEILKRVYDAVILEAGIKVLFSVKVCDVIKDGTTIKSIITATASGLRQIKGKVFIDATGDALVAAVAEVPFELGDESNTTMSPSLCVQYANVDVERFYESVRDGRSDKDIWRELSDKGEAPLFEYHLVGFLPHSTHAGSGNIGHVYGINCIDEFDITQGYFEGRKIAKIFHDFYKEYVPGFAESELVNTASLLSVRETRRIKGKYKLNYEDYKNRASFDDEIGRFSYPIDIHASSSNSNDQKHVIEKLRATEYKNGESYGIPYRSLLPVNIDNLLVAGRSISCDQKMQASIRVMPGCFLTGQACGVAASMFMEGESLKHLSIKKLRNNIKKIGGYIC